MESGAENIYSNETRSWLFSLRYVLVVFACLFVALFLSHEKSVSRLSKEYHYSHLSVFVFGHHQDKAPDVLTSSNSNPVLEGIFESESNNEIKELVLDLFSCLYSEPDSDKTYSTQSSSFHKTGYKIPFYILYHSWKSFAG